jgi:hypothetical protein
VVGRRKRRKKRRSGESGGETEPIEAEVIDVVANEYNL